MNTTRKGWHQVDVPTGWVNREGATATVRRVAKSFSAVSSENPRQPAAPPVPRGSQKPTPQEHVRRTPDDNRAAALVKIARIQASIHVLGMEDTEELQILKESLKKAENAAKIPLPQVQIDLTLDYIKRARKRLESADDKIAKAVQALRFAEEEKESDMKGIAESEARIKRVREEVEQNFLAEPNREMLHLHGGYRSLSSCANRLHSCGWRIGQKGVEQKRLREDYIPMCMADLVQWVADRQKDLQEAMSSGKTHDVTRLAQLVAEGGAQLKTWTAENHLSMVANSVNMVPGARQGASWDRF